MLIRALLAFIALPGVVAFLAPALLVWAQRDERPFRALGLLPLAAGAALLLWCVREFYVSGKGTLAPWHPPRHLVSSGPYRASRNPMYLAVGLILAGWTVGVQTLAIGLYTVTVMVAFHLRVVFGEEPHLARTFRQEWTRYTSRVPRWIFPHRRAAIAATAALVVGLLIAGLAYEAYADARDAREFPPPGMLIDIGGRRLHLLCIGDGDPIVLFEASGWGSSLSAAAARERIGARTRVCSYDRRGRGWSDPAPGITTAGALANDLGVLQDRAQLHRPLIVVAASIGGLTAEMFTRQYPERVAGLVLLDPAISLSVPLITSRAAAATMLACAGGVLSRFGVVRLLDPFHLGEASDEARQGAALTYNARAWSETCALARGMVTTGHELAQAPPLPPDLPLVVLSASSTVDLLPPGLERLADELRPQLLEHHEQFAAQSTRGHWQIVPDSTHLISESQPDAVADAVFDLLEQSVRDRRVAPRR
jgi:pimeloyl-ACP methyl ester carboxylesterase/protein-S-isoprenylcysteine O-methyltransferase Ste14